MNASTTRLMAPDPDPDPDQAAGSRGRPRRHLVIGIGNTLRGDDGVGALLAERRPCGLGMEARSVQQLTPELAADLAALEAVLFIDAWRAPAGAVPELSAIVPAADEVDSHQLQPAALLAISLALYGRAPQACLLRVPAHSFSHSPDLSAELRAALPEAQRLLRHWLANHA